MNFSKRIILSMLVALLLFAVINGVMVYIVIRDSDSENLSQLSEMMLKNEESSIDSWLDIARSITYPYVVLSNKYPDSTEAYKNTVLFFLKEIRWHVGKKSGGFYSIFDSKTGNAIMMRDSLGSIIPQNENALEITDINGKKFLREILEKSSTNDFSTVTFTYAKPCMSCPPMERIAKGIHIPDWDWVIATGNYSDNLHETSEFFSKKFKNSRYSLLINLFGLMLLSFLLCLFMLLRQIHPFISSFHKFSDYLHRLVVDGIRIEDFNLKVNSQVEIKHLSHDLNSLVHNVSGLMENVRVSADDVSNLSGECTDMLDIVDYDAKVIGQRTVEMAVSSNDVVGNVSGMAGGIGEINVNLSDLKKLTSHITDSTMDIKDSISKMSEAVNELNEKFYIMRNCAISVTQAVNDIGIANTEEHNKINTISDIVSELQTKLDAMMVLTTETRRSISQGVHLNPQEVIKNVCNLADELHNKVMDVLTQFADLQDIHVIPLALVVGERKKLSKEITSDTLNLDNSINVVANCMEDINSNSQYINSSIKCVSTDINEAYHNLEEIVVTTENMNEHAKQAKSRMDEFSLKSKRVEESHSAIERTLRDVKDSMKSLNDLSASLRQIVDDLVRLDVSKQEKK